MNLTDLRMELIRDEGLRLKPYHCTAGKLTIGVGRNIEDIGITKEEALYMLDSDISRICQELDKALPWWRTLSDTRRRVLVNMGFMGVPRLLGFVKALAAMKSGDYEEAAKQMHESRWAGQVGQRATRLCEMMRHG